jgi:hypothetical protein
MLVSIYLQNSQNGALIPLFTFIAKCIKSISNKKGKKMVMAAITTKLCLEKL